MTRPESFLPPDPLGLQQLPERRAPAALWPAIEARLQPQAKRRPRSAWLELAAAAAVAALIVVQLSPAPLSDSDPETLTANETGSQATPALDKLEDDSLPLDAAQRLSAVLEAELQRSRRHALPAEALAGLVWTETELRLTDELLAEDPANVELWRQRIGLLGELNRRYQRDHWQQDLRLTSI
jgi:hypothetical protein